MNEFAVIECGVPCSSILVTTVTPVANLDIAVRKSLLELKAYPLTNNLDRLYYSGRYIAIILNNYDWIEQPDFTLLIYPVANTTVPVDERDPPVPLTIDISGLLSGDSRFLTCLSPHSPRS